MIAAHFSARFHAQRTHRGDEPGPAGQVPVRRHVDESSRRGERFDGGRRGGVVVLDGDTGRRARSQRAASSTIAPITAMPSGPPNSACGGSCSATSGSSVGTVGNVGRVGDQQVDLSVESGSRPGVGDVGPTSSTGEPATLRRA